MEALNGSLNSVRFSYTIEATQGRLQFHSIDQIELNRLDAAVETAVGYLDNRF